MKIKETKANRNFELAISADELLALWEFIGKTSQKDREKLGLTEHQAKLLSRFYEELSEVGQDLKYN